MEQGNRFNDVANQARRYSRFGPSSAHETCYSYISSDDAAFKRLAKVRIVIQGGLGEAGKATRLICK